MNKKELIKERKHRRKIPYKLNKKIYSKSEQQKLTSGALTEYYLENPKYDWVEKYVKEETIFDWKEEAEAERYKAKWKSKGYKVRDVETHNDSIVLVVLKK